MKKKATVDIGVKDKLGLFDPKYGRVHSINRINGNYVRIRIGKNKNNKGVK